MLKKTSNHLDLKRVAVQDIRDRDHAAFQEIYMSSRNEGFVNIKVIVDDCFN